MRKFNLSRATLTAGQPLFCLLAAGLLSAHGCSDDTCAASTPDAAVKPDLSTLARYGATCAADGDCATGMCVDKTCSVSCAKQADCPSVAGKAFDCGEVSTGKLGCYPRRYVAGATDKMGDDCSLDGICAADHICTGKAGDGDRYCAGKCTTDRDCPPRYRCAATQTGSKAAETARFCLLRRFCHPCVMDDQCGVGGKCLKDSKGASFCSMQCTPPAATPDAGAVDGGPSPSGTCPTYARCEKVDSAYFCKHKTGSCGVGFDGKGSDCEPCIVHGWTATGSSKDPIYTVAEAGQCKTGAYCVLYDYYFGESACLVKCTQDSDCKDSSYLCLDYTTSLGTKVCRKWEYYDYGGTKYKVGGSCFK